MSTRTITLPDELVDRLETLARVLGRPLDEVVSDLLEHYSPTPANWALALAEAMEEADVDWQAESSLSARSREHFEQHQYEQWQRTQTAPDDD